MVFVIAEIGINWDGQIELAKTMIKNAKRSGCDAVKFQAFNNEIIGDHPEKERLLKSSISDSNIKEITSYAKKNEIEWLCTPMYVDAVELINKYVKKFKIRQSDGIPIVNNQKTKLLDAILKTDKNIIISSEISPKKSNLYNNNQVSWLYCVPKYPCKVEEIDFSYLNDFDGYSNHCQDILVPSIAASLGSKMIEIHVTNDKSKNFIDNPVSFDFKEVEEITTSIRKIEKIKK